MRPSGQLSFLKSILISMGVCSALSSTTEAVAGSVTYAYDTLGRVIRATYSSGVVIVYTYDAAGNRTSVMTSGAP